MLHKKTVYLRDEDLDLWAACPNKSLLVHNALTKLVIEPPPKDYPSPDVVDIGEDWKEKLTLRAEKVKGDHCNHGYNLKVSKCKFGCKK